MYVKNTVNIVKNLLAEDGEETRMKLAAKNPFPSGYLAELDVTAELHDEMISRFLLSTVDWDPTMGSGTRSTRHLLA